MVNTLISNPWGVFLERIYKSANNILVYNKSSVRMEESHVRFPISLYQFYPNNIHIKGHQVWTPCALTIYMQIASDIEID